MSDPTAPETEGLIPSTLPELLGEREGEATAPGGGEETAEEPVERRPDGSLTSYGASVLRKRAALKARQRNADAAEEARLSHLTARQRLGLSIAKISQADLDAVVAALVVRAKNGDEKAVNALARLLDQSFGRAGTEPPADPRDPDDKPWSEWTSAEKAEYRRALLAERDRLDAEETAAGDATDPREERCTQCLGKATPGTCPRCSPPGPRSVAGEDDDELRTRY